MRAKRTVFGGRSHVRKVLYMAALVATRFKPVILVALLHHDKRREDLRGEGGHGIAGTIDEAHGLAIDLRREDLCRNREERAPGHVAEESHAAQCQQQQALFGLVQIGQQHDERDEPDETGQDHDASVAAKHLVGKVGGRETAHGAGEKVCRAPQPNLRELGTDMSVEC